MHTAALTQAQIRERNLVSSAFGWMAIGLGVTALLAWATAHNEALLRLLFSNPILMIGLFVAQIGLVIYLSARIQAMSLQAAMGAFFVYSGLMGLTLSSIFIIYARATLTSAFTVTAGTFALTAVYGFSTKRDLTSVGNLAFMGLIGIILASLVNMFMHSPAVYWATTYLGVLIFVALTAYDVQRIKAMDQMSYSGEESYQKAAILGALRLYLDFINLFLFILRIMGSRR
ncbi:MAG: Bax inhibitor-1/YccA family protein [Candidatus Omnitrophica bacterium]|nr:Bax inhibitor-1/YccA family protein [Candidatus Omnitrophota bacterium]